ncbi:hypothetical protein EYF80_037935 [Liparis tanakae]|uniref:Uncharacterized protein n=1 Tax=Liparis tanakae TaxID=230148 RepID=A0A4Z2GEN4_9TELE|nr:hypothetical protein EYF80_037935 [Liparis tanakae]
MYCQFISQRHAECSAAPSPTALNSKDDIRLESVARMPFPTPTKRKTTRKDALTISCMTEVFVGRKEGCARYNICVAQDPPDWERLGVGICNPSLTDPTEQIPLKQN